MTKTHSSSEDLKRMASAAADVGATIVKSGELGLAAANVIGRRTALGFADMADPSTADHAEFARMVPEKVEAFSAAGLIMLERSAAISQLVASFAMNEAMIATQASLN